MSLFGNVSQQRSPFGSNAPQQVNNERLEQAALEVDMVRAYTLGVIASFFWPNLVFGWQVSDLFNRLVKSCHAKCIPEGYYREGSINKGEGVCLDR